MSVHQVQEIWGLGRHFASLPSHVSTFIGLFFKLHLLINLGIQYDHIHPRNLVLLHDTY